MKITLEIELKTIKLQWNTGISPQECTAFFVEAPEFKGKGKSANEALGSLLRAVSQKVGWDII